MSRNIEKIRQGLLELLRRKESVYSGIVSSVNEEEATCEVKLDDNDDLALPVMLRATVDGLSGIIIVPELGSEIVFCAIDDGDEFTLIRASKVAKVLIDVPELQIKCPKVVINDGNEGAMVKIKELEENVESLKKFAEAIHAALPGAFDAILASTSANGALGKAYYQGKMLGKKVVIKPMNDDKVKH